MGPNENGGESARGGLPPWTELPWGSTKAAENSNRTNIPPWGGSQKRIGAETDVKPVVRGSPERDISSLGAMGLGTSPQDPKV